MINLELLARQICEADHHTPWPNDDYNGRAQRRHYMKLAEAAHKELSRQLLSAENIRLGTIASVEQDSAPLGTALFDLHWNEFAQGYETNVRAAIGAMLER